MAAESLDLFDLERIKEIREEDITLPPHAKTRGSQGCIDRGNTAAARDLLVEIKTKDKEYEEFDAVTEAIIRKKGQENAADRLKELDNKLETVHRLVARFNQALSKVPSSVLEKVKKTKTEDKEFPPKLDFLAKVVKPMCNEMMAPAVTAPIMPPPPPIVPVKRVPSSSWKKQFTRKFDPDHYSTNKKSCDFDAALSKKKCFEIFEFIDTWNDEDDLHSWYNSCTTYICRRTLVNMWKRWHRQKAGENTNDLNKECCYYKHPLMWASLNEAWVEFCELREGKK